MSSSSSHSSEEHNAGPSSRRGGVEYEGPSSSRRRSNDEIWPEHFVESLAVQVAIDASLSFGRLSVAPALANVFQVLLLLHKYIYIYIFLLSK